MCHVLPHPSARFDWHKASRRLASALSWRCFLGGHHQLQHPPPTVGPAVPSSPSNAAVVHAPPLKVRLYLGVFVCEKAYWTGRAGDLGAGIRTFFFKSPLYMAFPTAVDPADRAVGPLSPLPCQAWHGYGVSSAHHREVRGCRRVWERTPLRGRRRCAAGGRLGRYLEPRSRSGRLASQPENLFPYFRSMEIVLYRPLRVYARYATPTCQCAMMRPHM
jgi:hypothetical protein